ncbi:unnamed protein product [Jaminaea pallidilutea]
MAGGSGATVPLGFGSTTSLATSIGSLSDELLLRILVHLSAKELLRAQRVCKRLRRLGEDPQLWKRLFSHNFIHDRQKHEAGVSSRSRFQLPALSDLADLISEEPFRASGGHERVRGLPARYCTASDDSILSNKLCAEDYARNDGLDWKALYRVSSNWQRGTFAITKLLEDRAPPVNSSSRKCQASPCYEGPERPQTLVQSTDELVFTASRDFTAATHASHKIPVVCVYYNEQAFREKPEQSVQQHASVELASMEPSLSIWPPQRLQSPNMSITDIKIDASPRDLRSASSTDSSVRLFVAYSNKNWTIFSLSINDLAPNTNTVLIPNISVVELVSGRLQQYIDGHVPPVVQSAFHWPLLATCTSNFHISVHLLPRSSAEGVSLIQRFSSQSCHWPATMSLSPVPYVSSHTRRRGKRRRLSYNPDERQRPEIFKLNLVSCSPSYPSNWSTCLQELIIDCATSSSSMQSIQLNRYASAVPKHPRMRSASSRSEARISSARQRQQGEAAPYEARFATNARPPSIFCPPCSDILPREKPSRNKIKSISYEGSLVVIGSDDNVLEVFEVHGSPASLRDDESVTRQLSELAPLELTHRRVLYGHMGSVLSVALDDGRCVSGSSDGSVMVWNLQQPNPSSDLGHRDAAHVVTLQASAILPFAGSDGASRPCAARELTLGDLIGYLRAQEIESSHDETLKPGAIKWVSSAFDRIVSVCAPQVPGQVGAQTQQVHDGESVKVWSFAV